MRVGGKEEIEEQVCKLFLKGRGNAKVRLQNGNDKINKKVLYFGNKLALNAAIIGVRKHRGA